MNPLVSAIIPAFNRELTVERSVRSALAQTYRNIEVIVVDDGSCDDTVHVLEQFGSRILVLQQANGGPSMARNFGASKARGEILAFLDSDDEWLPDKIEKQVRMMQTHGSHMPCCICNASYAAGRERSGRKSFELAGLKTPYENAILVNPLAVLTTTFLLFNQVAAIRREAFEQVGGFNPSLRLMEDYEMSVRLATLGVWGVLREALVLKHEDTAGIGVSTMNDELKHLVAQERVFESILINPQLRHPLVRDRIIAELRRVRTKHAVRRWMLEAPRMLLPVGHAILLIERLRKAVARRVRGSSRARMCQV